MIYDEFIEEKKRIFKNIQYFESKKNAVETSRAVIEYCQLFINANVTPPKSFPYWPVLEAIKNSNTLASTLKKEEVKSKSAKTILDTSEIKYMKKFMNNPNYKFTEKVNTLKDKYNIDKETLFTWFKELGIHNGPTQFEKAKFNKLKASTRYLISSAQTASPVNPVFLQNMEVYAKHINAEIGIIATRYKNPTSIWNEDGDVWDETVFPYLTAMRQVLHPKLSLLADLKIQATSLNPTSGLDSFEGTKSCIVGSPRVEMRSIPVLPGLDQIFLYSTGSVTEPSFTDTVAGGKAAEQHSFGFVIVEIDTDEVVHVRNVIADADGSFNDLWYRVENSFVLTEDVETLVWGDSHFAQKDVKVTHAFQKLCADLGIKKSVLHDVWDSQSINVHNIKNPIVQYQLIKEEKNILQDELNQMFNELDWFTNNMQFTLVVNSNHDDMIDRAMVQGDWRDNLQNAETFVKLLAIKLSGKANEGLVAHMINERYHNIVALGPEDSFIKHGVELGLHGHKGPNGSRGSINSFCKLPTPNIIGHSHSPGIKGNTVQVGLSCGMKHGYNQGLSSWAYASCTLNKRGARQLIILNKDTLTYTTL